MQQAVEILRKEMESKDNPYINIIGEYLINQMTSIPELIDLIKVNGKTIAGSIEEMKKVAKTKQAGGMAMLTDAEGFTIVLNYFGLNKQVNEINVVSSGVTTCEKKRSISIDLDALF